MIILASTSSTRQSMLTNAGVNFTVFRPRVDESRLLEENPAWTPGDASLHLARAKAMEVSRHSTNRLVVGADQVLSYAGRIYSKPPSIEAARNQLRDLRGKTHELISSVVCARNGSEIWNITCRAQMTMRNFSDDFLDFYLTRNGMNSMISVGAYQLEGLGSQLFERVDGDYFTILGLPLLPVMDFLRAQGELDT